MIDHYVLKENSSELITKITAKLCLSSLAIRFIHHAKKKKSESTQMIYSTWKGIWSKLLEH